jgi:hypothetical protein
MLFMCCGESNNVIHSDLEIYHFQLEISIFTFGKEVMNIKDTLYRTLIFPEGEYASIPKLQFQIQRLERMLEESKELITLNFRSALGGDTACSLHLALMIKQCGVETTAYAYDEMNSALIAPYRACTTTWMEFDCTCYIHPVNLPSDIPATYSDVDLDKIVDETKDLQDAYEQMLVSNCRGKLTLEKLREIMLHDRHRGDVIDADEALRLGIADRLFRQR